MPEIRSFSIRRTSGRDLTEVRRPGKPVPNSVPLDKLNKADLVTLAEKQGVDTTGTKAELLERLDG